MEVLAASLIERALYWFIIAVIIDRSINILSSSPQFLAKKRQNLYLVASGDVFKGIFSSSSFRKTDFFPSLRDEKNFSDFFADHEMTMPN